MKCLKCNSNFLTTDEDGDITCSTCGALVKKKDRTEMPSPAPVCPKATNKISTKSTQEIFESVLSNKPKASPRTNIPAPKVQHEIEKPVAPKIAENISESEQIQDSRSSTVKVVAALDAACIVSTRLFEEQYRQNSVPGRAPEDAFIETQCDWFNPEALSLLCLKWLESIPGKPDQAFQRGCVCALMRMRRFFDSVIEIGPYHSP